MTLLVPILKHGGGDGWKMDGRWMEDGWKMDGRWMEDGLEMNGRLNSIVQRKIIGYIKLFMSHDNIS